MPTLRKKKGRTLKKSQWLDSRKNGYFPLSHTFHNLSLLFITARPQVILENTYDKIRISEINC